MEVLNNISILLKEQDKKQIELTDHLGLSKNVFTEWKAGRANSYMKYLPQIADFFNVSVDYLLGREQTKKDSTVLNYGESPTKYKIKELIDTVLEKTDDEEELNALKIMIEKFAK